MFLNLQNAWNSCLLLRGYPKTALSGDPAFVVDPVIEFETEFVAVGAHLDALKRDHGVDVDGESKEASKWGCGVGDMVAVVVVAVVDLASKVFLLVVPEIVEAGQKYLIALDLEMRVKVH